MTPKDEELLALAERMRFAVEAFALRETRGWPNDPVANALIVYQMYGWDFNERDVALIKPETRTRTTGDDKP
jgi:hypothetical protein